MSEPVFSDTKILSIVRVSEVFFIYIAHSAPIFDNVIIKGGIGISMAQFSALKNASRLGL